MLKFEIYKKNLNIYIFYELNMFFVPNFQLKLEIVPLSNLN